MRAQLLLGVKMCGNCNPSIEAVAVAQRIAAGLNARIVPFEEGQVPLTISACLCACVDGRYPCPVQIQGLCLNRYACRDENELVARAIERLREQINPMKQNLR